MSSYDWILLDLIDRYGDEIQHKIAIGEIGELLALYGREIQGRATRDDWIDEIADLVIASRKLALMYGVDAVEDRVEEKIQRTKETWLDSCGF